MSETAWDDIKRELREIRENMATKADLAGMASELRQSIVDLKKTMTEYHIENSNADEKLLELITEVKCEVEHHTERLTTNEHSIQILHRNQLYLETEVEKIKASLS